MLVSEAHIEQRFEMMAPSCRHAVLRCCYGMPRTWTPSVLQVLCILHQHLCCNTADQLYSAAGTATNAPNTERLSGPTVHGCEVAGCCTVLIIGQKVLPCTTSMPTKLVFHTLGFLSTATLLHCEEARVSNYECEERDTLSLQCIQRCKRFCPCFIERLP